MNVALIDIDSHNFPNLPLMKLSAFHKKLGDNTILLKPNEYLEGCNLFDKYDKVYGACVFTENKELAQRIENTGAYVAGSGTGKPDTLPDEIEHIMPDYDLYNIKDEAYGFLTRGCPRGCPFCIVAHKEGKNSHKVADLKEWWLGQKYIKLLDPNLLAAQESDDLLKDLIESNSWIDFTQGVDARLLTDERINLLKNMKIKRLHFAWDNPRDNLCRDKLDKFSKAVIRTKHDASKYIVYILTNYWSTLEEDLYRVYWLRDNGFNPYVMIYDKPNAPKEIRRLQNWVNNRQFYGSVKRFEDFDLTMRGKNPGLKLFS